MKDIFKQNKIPIILALTSAFLLWLGWPPIPYSAPILWFAFVPLLLAVEHIIRNNDGPDGPANTKKGKRVFWISFLALFIWNTSSIYWVYNSVAQVMPTYAAIPISLIPFGLAASLMAFSFWLYYRLRIVHSIYIALLGFIGVWIAYEYLHQTWDLAFPWMTLGNGFASFHQLIQWYEFTGVYGGSAWILISNALLFLLLLSKRDGQAKSLQVKLGVATLLWICLPCAISLLQYVNYEEDINPCEVVVVQPNIDPYGKFGSIPPEEQLETLVRLSTSVAATNTEFFVWPETAIAHRFGYDEDRFREHPAFDRIQTFLSDYKNASLVSGIESFKQYDEALTPTAREWDGVYYDHFNAVVLLENSAHVQFYHKSKLVPGVEKLPFGAALSFMKPLFKAFGGTTGGYGSQDEPSVLYSQHGIGAAPIVCYESIWGNYVAEFVNQGAQLITIVTNDGWWGNTSGKDQHFDYARLRAIETRRWVARAANTGISGFINQRGDVLQRTDWWTEAALKQEINLNEELTVYVKTGDWIAYVCIGMGMLSLVTLVFRRRKR